MKLLRISLSFRRKRDMALHEFAGSIILGLTNHPVFIQLPVSVAELQALTDAFWQALSLTNDRSKLLTVVKKQARLALVAALRTLARHVENNSGQDPVLMTSTGFSLMSTNRAQSELARPVILRLDYGPTTTLLATLIGVRNAKCYEFEVSTDGENWFHAGSSTRTRKAVVNKLTPGVLYHIRVRAVGGKTGYSPWSEIIQHRAV